MKVIEEVDNGFFAVIRWKLIDWIQERMGRKGWKTTMHRSLLSVSFSFLFLIGGRICVSSMKELGLGNLTF